MPVTFGTFLALGAGEADLKLVFFLVALIAIVLLHGAANVLNDVSDYRRGLDSVVYPVSGAVVRKLISPEQALRFSKILFIVGTLLGLWLAHQVGWLIFLLGLVGVALGSCYSSGRFGFKYWALGDLVVFLCFGLLGVLGAWVLQTGSFSWQPVLMAVPLGLLVTAILHANNWRDLEGDRRNGILTIAGALGQRYSSWYFNFLILAPFIYVIMGVAADYCLSAFRMATVYLIVLAALPLAGGLVNKARLGLRQGGSALGDLDGATARLNLVFGLLYSVAALFAANVKVV